MRYLGQPDEGTGAQELWGCCVPQSGSLRLSLAREPAPKIGGEQVEAAPEGRPYDLVIWGATGFTGRLMVEHLDALVSSGETKGMAWALAGRSEKRLRALAAQCKSGPAVLVAQQDLEQVAAQASVFISAAGPYTQCGEAAVRACVLSRTHYVDVAGETVWLHQMIQRYHQEARAKGVLLVHACAQVCAIDDLNCYLLAQRLGPLKQFREYFFQFGGTTGGTFAAGAAAFEAMTEESFRVYSDPFSLGGRRSATEEDYDCAAAVQDLLYPGLWLQPAYNGHTGGRILRRSSELFQSGGPVYGDLRVVIRDAATSQKAAESGVRANAPPQSVDQAHAAAGMMKQQVAQGSVPKPGEGPPPETRALYYAEVFAVAEAQDGRWAYVHYTGPEAYEVTAMAAVTGALVILEEQIAQPERCGSVTPAFAFHGTSFVQRLQKVAFAKSDRKMCFRLIEGKPSEETLREAVVRKTKSAAEGQAELMSGKLAAWSAPA